MTSANLTNEPSENGINRKLDECPAIFAPLRIKCQAVRNKAAPKAVGGGLILHQTSETVASARARWLGELAEALEEALRLAILLGEGRPESDEAVVLRERILAVRAELAAMRRRGIGEIRREIAPDWTNLATWRGNLVERPEL